MSLFDGTWRPDIQKPGPDAPVEELVLAEGVYRCLSCDPAYEVPADGGTYPVTGSSRFDELAITVIDDRTVRRVATLEGRVVVDATTVLSPFGHTKRETQRQFAISPFDFAVTSRRIGESGPPGAHRLSGRWQPIEADLPNHEEDTVYRVADGVFSMRDGLGRAYDAPLDGTPVPYLGDPRFTTVRVRQIDDRTVEEINSNGTAVVLKTRWEVDPDGQTIHVRFEYASGLIQEQDGRRLD